MSRKYEYLPLRGISVQNFYLVNIGCLTIVGAPLMAPFVLSIRSELKTTAKYRQRMMRDTGDFLLSTANYVGGHPLLPHSGKCVLGLSTNALTIYNIERTKWSLGFSVRQRWEIAPAIAIPLTTIVNTYTGRPKSAQEVYRADFGTTIDVIEQSPFLNVVFEEKGKKFQISFQDFDPWVVSDLQESGGTTEMVLKYWGLGMWKLQSPQDWHNYVISLKYQTAGE